MWAMLLSLAVTVPMMLLMFFETLLLMAVIAFCTLKNRMNVLWWVIATAVLNCFVFIPYVIVRAITALRRCPECGTIINRTHRNVCPDCFSRVKKINDKKFAQWSILAYFIFALGIAVFRNFSVIFMN